MAGRQQRGAKIAVDGGQQLSHNPFDGALTGLGAALPQVPQPPANPPSPQAAAQRSGGGARIEVRRVKAGRGGKTVTEIRGIAAADVPYWLERLKKRCAVGGTQRAESFELQGEQVAIVSQLLGDAGYRVVRTGG